MKAESLPQNMIDKMDPKDRKISGLKTSEEIANGLIAKNEKEIQAAVEAYLTHLGYEKRVPNVINTITPRSGWQIHLRKPKGNPILLDIIVMQFTDIPGEYRCVEVELKTEERGLSPEQKSLVGNGAPLFRSAKEAVEFFKPWHLKGLT